MRSCAGSVAPRMNSDGALILEMLRVSRYTVAVPVAQDRFALMNAASGAVDIVSCRVAEAVCSWEQTGVDASTAMGDLIASLRTRGYLTDDSREEELRAVRRQSSPAVQDRVFPATTSSTRSSPPQIQGFHQTKEASSPPGRPRLCDHWQTMDIFANRPKYPRVPVLAKRRLCRC